ncbi:MAG: hypothetical protein PHP02_07625 [Eubacteriales bacterium]|nr:hypothetical protein [Eubacteriales bacterium]
MKGISRRFIALFAALMMFVSVGGALAEAPASPILPNAEAVLVGGGTIGFEASARFDEATLKGLLGMFMGGGAGDEATTTIVNAILGALNKLVIRGAYAKGAFSGFLGTENGELIDLQAAYDEASMENTFTTNLLPGLAVSVDPEMIKSVMGQMPMQISQAQAEAMLAPYGAVVMGFLEEQFGPRPQIAAEPYDIEGAGLFHFRADFDITTREAAELVEKLYDIFKNDQNVQALLKQAAAAGGEESTEALEEMESGIAEMKAAEDEVFLVGSVYMNEAGDTTYVVVDTPEEADGRAHITVLVKGKAVNVKVIVKGEAMPSMTAEETPAPVAEIDWAQVEAAILSGESFTDTLVTVDTDVQAEANKLSTATRVNLIVSGLNIVVEVDGTSLMDKLETQAETRFYMGSQSPLVTFTARMYEADEHPLLPQLEGRTVVTVMMNEEGELIPSDRIALQKAAEGLPALIMENLVKALPEEGPTLLAIITDYLTIDESQTTGPEPVVVEEAEPAETVVP